jgi:hypothetical protein
MGQWEGSIEDLEEYPSKIKNVPNEGRKFEDI